MKIFIRCKSPLFYFTNVFQANWKAPLETVLVSLVQWLVPASLSCIRKHGVEMVNVEENSKIV